MGNGPHSADNLPEGAAKPGSRDAPYSVSRVVQGVNRTLDRVVGTIWIEGEVVNPKSPASGHLYFSLRDSKSEVRAVMWRSDRARLKFKLENGTVIRARVRLGVYGQGGHFQVYIQTAEPAGLGADALALAQLRQRLADEGLFDSGRKRPLPHIPRRIGVVTSKTGAAVRDIVRAIHRRFPVPILVAHTQVQGPTAPREIAAALALIARADVDVIVVGRGGGSAGDLSAFNDERVVRAVVKMPVPVVSAVGHEVDTSLTDLVADHRAATPTMAGEMVVPVIGELAELIAIEERRLRREIRHQLDAARQRVDGLIERGRGSSSRMLARRRRQLATLGAALEQRHPRARLGETRRSLAALERRLERSWQGQHHQRRSALATASSQLHALSPLAVLERGYAIASSGDRVLVDTRGIAPGDPLLVRLRRGELQCRVESLSETRADLSHDEED